MIRSIVVGLISLSPLVLLTGCGLCPKKETLRPVIVDTCPLQPIPLTPYPSLTGTTNEALLRMVAQYEAALRSCNTDKRLINKLLEQNNNAKPENR